MTMTPERLAELRERASRLGPWIVRHGDQYTEVARLWEALESVREGGKIYERLSADAARQVAVIEQQDKALEQLIKERDEAEEALSQAYFLIIGRSPPWSSNWGKNECLEEIDAAQTMLRQAIKPRSNL